jgi:hypothetical protein
MRRNNIGKVRLAQGDAPEALREFRIALAGREKLAAKDPNNAGAQRDLASINAEIGGALIGQGQIASAPTRLLWRSWRRWRRKSRAAPPCNAICRRCAGRSIRRGRSRR